MHLPHVVAAELLHGDRERLRDRPGALDHDRLEQLGAHHRAHARPSARTTLEAPDDGEVDHVLAALADVQDPGALPVAGVDPLVRVHRALAPDLVGGQELDPVVVDGQEGGPLRPPLDDQGVVARLAELVRDARAEVPVPVAARGRGLGGDDRLARVGGRDARDGADGDHELVLRAERVDPRGELVVQDLDREPATADPGVGELLREGLRPPGPRRQVDPQELPGPSIHDSITLGWHGARARDTPVRC